MSTRVKLERYGQPVAYEVLCKFESMTKYKAKQALHHMTESVQSTNRCGLLTTLVLKTMTEDQLVIDIWHKVFEIYKPKMFFGYIKMKQLKFGFKIFLF